MSTSGDEKIFVVNMSTKAEEERAQTADDVITIPICALLPYDPELNLLDGIFGCVASEITNVSTETHNALFLYFADRAGIGGTYENASRDDLVRLWSRVALDVARASACSVRTAVEVLKEHPGDIGAAVQQAKKGILDLILRLPPPGGVILLGRP